MITIYNLKPRNWGWWTRQQLSTANTRVYDGFEISANARIKGGGFLIGSITTDRVAVNNCDVANSDPNGLRFCQQTPPFRGLYKLSASYPLPWDIKASGTFQLRPGNPIGSNYTFNSTVAGVALTGGGNRTVVLVDPTTKYYDYIRQMDVRVARTFARRHEAADLREIFNLPNVSNRADGQRNLWTALAPAADHRSPRHFLARSWISSRTSRMQGTVLTGALLAQRLVSFPLADVPVVAAAGMSRGPGKARAARRGRIGHRIREPFAVRRAADATILSRRRLRSLRGRPPDAVRRLRHSRGGLAAGARRWNGRFLGVGNGGLSAI